MLLTIALLPGPGTYECNYASAEQFDRPPSAKLKPRKVAAVPRRVILPETLDILTSPSQKQPSRKAENTYIFALFMYFNNMHVCKSYLYVCILDHYDLEFDPRKSNRSFCIGEVLPMPKKGKNG